jgi:hypothetical protein
MRIIRKKIIAVRGAGRKKKKGSQTFPASSGNSGRSREKSRLSCISQMRNA